MAANVALQAVLRFQNHMTTTPNLPVPAPDSAAVNVPPDQEEEEEQDDEEEDDREDEEDD